MEPLLAVDPKVNAVGRPVVEVTLVVVPPNNSGFDVAPKENPEDCAVVTADAVVVLPKENNGLAAPGVLIVVVFVIVEGDPKLNPMLVPFDPPNIFYKFHILTISTMNPLEIILMDEYYHRRLNHLDKLEQLKWILLMVDYLKLKVQYA